MNKKIILAVSLAVLFGICISGILFSDELFKTDIHDVMSEKRHIIQNQENIEITLSIPKSRLSESIYTSEGEIFSENEIVVYQTDTTSIYLDKIFLSNDSDEHLCFIFNHSYDLHDSGTVLYPLKKTDNGYSTEGLSLASYALMDDTTTYPEALFITGHGPSELFTISIPVDVCKKAVGTMKIDLFINQITYARTK